MKVVIWYRKFLKPLKPMFDEVDPINKIFIREDELIIDNGYHEYEYKLNEIEKLTFGEIDEN